ncbi:uncharacterized protein LOC134283654 isoform X2 [Saccostrea cucullata]|uniref:uncharacterized protein LOC134283654 isoform X2 n=1 Tax=Saccostrea cuccullata TaxID=36930 RepID=UPI002ED1D5C5
MKILIVAVLVACFMSCYGQKTQCLLEDPVDREIDGGSRAQTTDMMQKIDAALEENTEVKNSVNEISAERVEPIENKHFALDTCPRKLGFITFVVVNDETCYVVLPKLQRVTYAICGVNDCYGSKLYKSTCIRDGWTKLRFWVWCPKRGFQLVSRWYPQCCSCYRWRSCFEFTTA